MLDADEVLPAYPLLGFYALACALRSEGWSGAIDMGLD